jgi:hypothetical protein
MADVSENKMDTILSRIILTVESITEKFEGIKGELGETGQKYNDILEELKRLHREIEIIKSDKNPELYIITEEISKRIDKLEITIHQMGLSFKENTDIVMELKKKNRKKKCTVQ